MGSSKSKSESPNQRQREEARLQAYREDLSRQSQQLEAERNRLREQHWKDQQLLEDQKRRETVLEWQRQADLRQVRLQQQKLQKELEEQKVQRQLEQEHLLKQLEEQKKKQAQLEEQRLQLERVQLHQPVTPKVCTIPSTSLASRETVAVQQTAPYCSLPIPKSTPFYSKPKSSPVQAKPQSTPVQSKPKPALIQPKEAPKSYLVRMSEANVKCVEWSIIDYVKDENSISRKVAENIRNLVDNGNAIPFVARYRRHLTKGMDSEKLRKVWNSFQQAVTIKQRAVAIVKDVDEKGQWTPEFHAYVHEAKSIVDLEHIRSVFKKQKSKAAKRAADLGLEIVAKACLESRTAPVTRLVQELVEGQKTVEEVQNGIVCLIADIVIKDKRTFNQIKKLRSEYVMEIQTTKGKGAEKLKREENKYEPYYNFTMKESDLRPDLVFAISRGEELNALGVKINIPDEVEREFKNRCLQQYEITGNEPSLNRTLIEAAIDLAYTKSKGLIAKRVKQEINEKAQNATIENLKENVKHHLLAPPVRGKVVMGISPGFEKGCSLAVVSEQGDVLETGTIFPHINNARDKSDAERALVRMICSHKCTVLALGKGAASKETEVFLVRVLKKNKKVPSDVFYTFVDDTGVPIYSCSREAVTEFPRTEADIVSAVSIARRLQDPMAELVKLEPEFLTTEIYHQEIFRQTISDLVSHVGVDANTASTSLLKRVSGLDEALANAIVEWRRSSGPFVNRNDLLKVKGINKRIFEQCAGFIRIVPATAVAIGGRAVSPDSFNPLDQTWIHPESYGVAKALLEAANCNILQLGTSSFTFTVNLFAQTGYTTLAQRFGSNAETIETIVQGLLIEKGLDIRGMEDSTMFRRGIIRYNDLSNGDILTGVVVHLAQFGAFVDVGSEIDGMIHKNFMNGFTVQVDQKVEVRVSKIRKERGRLGLTLIRCL